MCISLYDELHEMLDASTSVPVLLHHRDRARRALCFAVHSLNGEKSTIQPRGCQVEASHAQDKGFVRNLMNVILIHHR